MRLFSLIGRRRPNHPPRPAAGTGVSPVRTRAAMGACVLALALMAASPSAAAAEFVVLEAEGVSLSPGTVLEGHAPLSLPAGARLRLIAPNGEVLSLNGPHDGAPMASTREDESGLGSTLVALLQDRGADSAVLGATRALPAEGHEEYVPPNPWLINVASSGDRCLREGEPVRFWRPLGGLEEEILIRSADRSWSVKGVWPSYTNELAPPEGWQQVDGASYVIAYGVQNSRLQLHIIPEQVTRPLIQAAWMVEKGCLAQAEALLMARRAERDAMQ